MPPVCTVAARLGAGLAIAVFWVAALASCSPAPLSGPRARDGRVLMAEPRAVHVRPLDAHELAGGNTKPSPLNPPMAEVQSTSKEREMAKRHSKPSTKTNSNTNTDANTKERPAAEPENDFGDPLPLKWEIKDIPLGQLEIDEQHFEREVKQAEVEAMAESLKELGGVIHPLTVRPIMGKPGHFGIISGRERFEAAQLIGLETLSCRVLEDCSNEQARKISIHENLKRSSVSPKSRKEAIAELVELTKAELLRQGPELEPSVVPGGKRGPKPTLEATAKKVAAAKAGVTTRFVQIAVKDSKRLSPKAAASSAAGEMDATDTKHTSSPTGRAPVTDDVAQRFARIAGKAARFRRDIDIFVESIADGGTDVLANVDLNDVGLLFSLVPSWKRLMASIPKDLKRKAKEEPVTAPTSPAAEASVASASDQPTAPATTFSQLLLSPLPPKAPASAT